MLRRTHRKKVVFNSGGGQAMIEFTFCMIIIFLMVYAIMMVLRWTGMDLAERRVAHESQLRTWIDEEEGGYDGGPVKQIDPYFYTPIKINAVWGE